MEPELKEEDLGSCWLLKVLRFIPLLSRIPADSTTHTMGGQMDTRELPLLMGQIIPCDAKEQGFLLTGDVPWTRFPGFSSYPANFMEDHRPASHTRLLLELAPGQTLLCSLMGAGS